MRQTGFDFDFDEKKCAECGGKCCTGESGYIFLNTKEMQDIADFLNLDFETFTKRFVRKVGYKFSLIEVPHNKALDSKNVATKHKNLACIFFEDGKCNIYKYRPTQCKNFPFWEIYKHARSRKKLASECIGVKFDA